MITLVVFSKDRAMQLDSLLRSVKDYCTGIDRVVPIVYASNALHENAYWKLAHEAPFTELRMQVGDPLGKLVEEVTTKGSDHIALAVDDMLFYARSDFRSAARRLRDQDAFVWSWRLGHKPGVTREIADFWDCAALTADRDYGYLFHSDGALYRTEGYLRMVDGMLPDWRTGEYTPNDIEGAVACRKRQWAPQVGPHLGPLHPTCITWQLNRVQTKYGSPAAEIPETNVDALARAYLDGARIDNEKLYAALRENALRFNPPGTRPTHVWACEEASRFWAAAIR